MDILVFKVYLASNQQSTSTPNTEAFWYLEKEENIVDRPFEKKDVPYCRYLFRVRVCVSLSYGRLTDIHVCGHLSEVFTVGSPVRRFLKPDMGSSIKSGQYRTDY